MIKKSVYAVLVAVLLLVPFLAGILYNQHAVGKKDDVRADRRVLYYVDPMNPSHTSDRPGYAPCGMPFEPVYADEGGTAAGPAEGGSPMHPGAVRISSQKQQMMAVQVAAVGRTAETHAVRTLGRVAPDENLIYRILASEDGWMWNIRESTTGSLVQKDQLMGSCYNYLFLARQQQYLYAVDLAERRQVKGQAPAAQQSGTPQTPTAQTTVPQTPTAQTTVPQTATAQPTLPQTTTALAATPHAGHQHGQQFNVPLASYEMAQTSFGGINPASGLFFYNNPLEIAKLELHNLGVSEYQMKEIARTKELAKDLEIRSPVTGIVLARNVSPEQRFTKGSELFRVADISRVWVLADVFSREAAYVRPGMRARVTVPEQSRVIEAVVTNVPSQFDPVTRALRVRLEADNPEIALRPDMFVDVEFLIDLPVTLTAPLDAVLDSGIRKTVFVDRGNGFFEPREVKTGWRFGDLVEIREGLEPGERIVISGNFLIDSESRMKLARAGLHGALSKCPSCGMDVSQSKAKAEGMTAQRDGQTVYFCSPECMKQFEEEKIGAVKTPPAGPARKDGHTHSHVGDKGPSVAGGEKKSDHCPVCSMVVTVSKAKAAKRQSDYLGEHYYFCSEACKLRFATNPGHFLAKKRDKTPSPMKEASTSKPPERASEPAGDHRAETPGVPQSSGASGHHGARFEPDSGNKVHAPHSAHARSTGMSDGPAKAPADLDLKQVR
ncbi:MAG: efflux RND transporter periplasmic adaptor subunit [Syntrophobacteraceae bacterium]